MSLGATCSVCNHKDVTLANASLAQGVSQRRVATSLGVGHDAVRRHVLNQHPGVIVAGEDTAGVVIPTGASSREQLDAIITLLNKKLANNTIRVDEMRELRLTIDAIEKLGGGPAPEVTKVSDIEGYAEYEAAMMEALEPFPLARQALAKVLRERLGKA